MNRFLDFVLRKQVRSGDLTVTWADGTRSQFGDGTGRPSHVAFKTSAAERRVALNPQLQIGETYMDGLLIPVDGSIYDFLMTVVTPGGAPLPAWWLRALDRLRIVMRGYHQLNNKIAARRNVSHHYDLDGDLYKLFLDSDMQYSCAYFPTPSTGLEQAQLLKKRHIAAKMLLEKDQKILDIGSGWGGMGLYLANTMKADVTGVTLSSEQQQVSTERAAQAGLSDRVGFHLKDYRDLDETFNRIVSVGMFEHVGAGNYDEYFSTVRRLLDEDGVMILHSIGRFDVPGATNPFIRKYIFPGGYIPALSEVTASIERSGLLMTDIEILCLHYAETLRAWRERFIAHWDEAASIYDERFCRMWEFYLAGAESSFRLNHMMVFQIQLTRKQGIVPMTRDYIGKAEDTLRRLEVDSGHLRMAGT